MADWIKVKWSEARQIAAAMDLPEGDQPDDGVAPRRWYEQLVEAGEIERAVTLLGHALPRYEGIAWAARIVEARSHRVKLPPRDQQALDRALRWVDDPTDEFRRDAFVSAEDATEGSAERLLGTAVFLSGGSIAPDDLPPVLPPPQLSGRLAASAVMVAAYGSEDPEGVLREALSAGEHAATGAGTAA
ncbi:MAG: hypothetical protein JO013_13080 [Alphaproteobacteria bacterium]|nr:hypothetical protein [Alphaproteobacteria bacterium]